MWDAGEGLSTQEENGVVKEMVRAIMVLDTSKKPFKQCDITSYLNRKLGRNCFNKVLEEVKVSLRSIGLELVEVRDTSVKSFFLISKQKPLPFMHKYDNKEEVSNRILLTLILSYIYIKNGTVVSGDLLNHLRDLKIYDEGNNNHKYFGNVKKKVLQDFVDQLYLSSKKIPDSDYCDISWGQRAELEISKASILDFITKCGLNGKRKLRGPVSNFRSDTNEESQEDNAMDLV